MKEISNIVTAMVPTDDIPLSSEFQQAIVGNSRASLQIDSNPSSLPSFMKSGTYDEGCSIHLLNNPIVIEFEAGAETWQAEFRRYVIYSGKVPPPDEFGQAGRTRLKINSYPSSHIKAPRFIWGQKGVLLTKCKNGDIVDLKKVIIQAITKFNELSSFDLIREKSPYNTVDKVCYFYRNSTDPFGPLKVPTTTRLDSFHEHKQSSCSELERLLDFNPDWPEEAVLQDFLHAAALKNKQDISFNRAHEKIYYGWLRQVISFEDEFGQILMIVIKLYLPQNQTKVLVPITNWMERGSPQNKLYCLPIPTKQILLHLKRLLAPEVSKVIISPIEIASVNQANAPKNVVWTGFLCSPGEYGQVDFSPLQKGGVDVYLLICNHSGKNLEESYVEARGLADHLIEKYELKLRFIQVGVDYHDK